MLLLNTLGERQKILLRTLHAQKEGLTIDELVGRLAVTRTAVKQHLVALEQSGYLVRGALRLVTRGRPGRIYKLSERGIDLFPKQYSWFSSLLLGTLKSERGSDGLTERLRSIARTIAGAMATRVEGLLPRARTEAIVKIMNELSYEAVVEEPGSEDAMPGIKAHNCVYHHLAKEFPEVCEFDIEMLEKMSGAKVEHTECIIRGGNVCRFAFKTL